MRAAITTFFDHSNFGAVLQAYALQTKIEHLGAEACHISFSPKSGTIDKLSGRPESMWLEKMRYHSELREARFKTFRDRYLHVCPLSGNVIEETDVFITGSDQVFNASLPGWTDRFLLSFVSGKRKTAYAASFGDRPGNTALFANALSTFDSISVREASAVQTVTELIGKTPVRVLDPVFLLDRSEWSAVADSSDFSAEKPYVLFVMVQNNMALYKQVCEYAKSNNLDLRLISMSFFPPAGFDPWSGVSVEDYLKMIRDAELVVTSSFHALAFSIIFGKHFNTMALEGELADRNCRITELLDLLGLEAEDNGANCLNSLSRERVFSEKWLNDEILRH